MDSYEDVACYMVGNNSTESQFLQDMLEIDFSIVDNKYRFLSTNSKAFIS